MKNYTEFYKQLGNLLYAMAAIDGNVAEKEMLELRRIVKDELVPHEFRIDEFGTDAAFSVEFQFDMLQAADNGSEMAWEEVSDYLERNAAKLPERDLELMMRASERVADAFHGINKQEHELLRKLGIYIPKK